VAIDVLVNSAGITGKPGQRAGNVDYESWATVLNVNTMGHRICRLRLSEQPIRAPILASSPAQASSLWQGERRHDHVRRESDQARRSGRPSSLTRIEEDEQVDRPVASILAIIALALPRHGLDRSQALAPCGSRQSHG
jgi:hypothetical protein